MICRLGLWIAVIVLIVGIVPLARWRLGSGFAKSFAFTFAFALTLIGALADPFGLPLDTIAFVEVEGSAAELTELGWVADVQWGIGKWVSNWAMIILAETHWSLIVHRNHLGLSGWPIQLAVLLCLFRLCVLPGRHWDECTGRGRRTELLELIMAVA